MPGKISSVRVSRLLLVCALWAVPLSPCGAERLVEPETLVQIGTMHEAIGMGQHQGRVDLSRIIDIPNFYGVGALAGLRGEITIVNSVATLTGVAENGRPQPIASTGARATMLVGQSVTEWSLTTVAEDVPHTGFDAVIAEMAAKHGVDVSEPFVFVIEGEFTDVRMHVINGACPVHARTKNRDIAPENRPFELEVGKVSGTLVAVHAVDSAGRLTHPATSTHAHLVRIDEESSNRVTGHLERVGLARGAILKFPLSGARGEAADRE